MIAENVGELISKNLIYVNSDSNTIKAAILMRENDISCLVVKEKGDFVGIVTEKDLINKSWQKNSTLEILRLAK